MTQSVNAASRINAEGVTVERRLTHEGVHPFDEIEWEIREDLRRGDLVEVMSDYTCDEPADGGVPVWVVYAQTGSVSPPLKSRVFVDMVKDVMAREVLAPIIPARRRG